MIFVNELRAVRVAFAWVVAFLLIMQLPACKDPAPKPVAKPSTATAPTTVSTTTQAVRVSKAPESFIELIKVTYPDFPATQPLDSTADRRDSAHIVLKDHIYLDEWRQLWITRTDAPPLADTLKKAGKADGDISEHFVSCTPRFVFWRLEPAVQKIQARNIPAIIIQKQDGDDIQIIDEYKTITIKPKSKKYFWNWAQSWNDGFVVTSPDGASYFQHSPDGWVEIASPALNDATVIQSATKPATATTTAATNSTTTLTPTTAPAAGNPPIVLTMYNAVIAFIPTEITRNTYVPGSKNVARFTIDESGNGQWTIFGGNNNWPGNFLHLVPLADGSVLQLIAEADKKVQIAFSDFNTVKVDQKYILSLLNQLDDDDAKKRDVAFKLLSAAGPSSWPILEAQMPGFQAETRLRIEKLLKNKTEPTIGELTPIDSELKVAARARDGSVLLYSKGGVAVTNVDGDQTLAQNAWISIRPGEPINLLVGQIWMDVTPENKKFFTIGSSDWLVSDEGKGVQELIGTFELVPILRKSEVEYQYFAGIDRTGRWHFKKVDAAGHPLETPTLILDPHLPPVKPRLPVWAFTPGKGDTGLIGCDDQNWPAYEDGGKNVWILTEAGFKLLDKKKHKFIYEPAELAAMKNPIIQPIGANSPSGKDIGPSATSPGTSGTKPSSPGKTPTTQSIAPNKVAATQSTLPATTAVKSSGEEPNLILADGTRFFVLNDIIRYDRNGKSTVWNIPNSAQGSIKPRMVADMEGHLFLFNVPGRLLRLAFTPDSDTVLKVDATFTHKIPNVEVDRMWIDPAGRLIFVHERNRMEICFPSGIIPTETADQIPATQLDDDQE